VVRCSRRVRLLSPDCVRVGVEIVLCLGTCTCKARVKYVCTVLTAGCPAKNGTAIRLGTQGKSVLFDVLKRKGCLLFFGYPPEKVFVVHFKPSFYLLIFFMKATFRRVEIAFSACILEHRHSKAYTLIFKISDTSYLTPLCFKATTQRTESGAPDLVPPQPQLAPR